MRKNLRERCRLNLHLLRLDSALFRQCALVRAKILNKLVDRLDELHHETFVDFPKIECKSGAGVLVDKITKNIKFKYHYKMNLLAPQKHLYKAFPR